MSDAVVVRELPSVDRARRGVDLAWRLGRPVFAIPAGAGIMHEAACGLVAHGMARSVESVADVVAGLIG